MKNKDDLRVPKMRKNITESFLALLEKKPLEEISVTEICAGANCSRNTFYLHFPYKEALYAHVMDAFVDKITNHFVALDTLPEEGDVEASAMRYMRTIGEAVLSQKAALLPILNGDHANVFFHKLTNELRRTLLINTDRIAPGASGDDKYRLMCWYSASAIVGFLMGCIYDVDMPTNEAMDILCAMHAPPFAVATRYLAK